jgi:competence protein ComEC
MVWSRFGSISFRAPRPRDKLDRLVAESGWVRRSLSRLWTALRQGVVLMLAVWMLTAPLVAARFHLVSPVGLLLNVALMPVGFVLLLTGYAFLFCGWLMPPAALLFGFAFDRLLGLMLFLVELAASVDLGHLYTPAPPAWWLIGYYGLIAAAFAVQYRPRWHARAWTAVLAWTVMGLAVGLRPAPAGTLRATVLSVGHGLAVLIETPNGKTMLYDAGSLQDGRRAEQTVEQALWERSRFGLDAVIVSHADIDHFNAVPGLLENIPVGTLCTSRQCVRSGDASVDVLCNAARRERTFVRLLEKGDRLRLDERVQIEVLRPARGDAFGKDNANSIVLCFEFAGRRILLTGDLEGEGLAALIAEPPRKIDVLLSPHHGSPAANPPELAAWAEPRYVIASGGRTARPELLEKSYVGAQVFSTFEDGAVTCEIAADGTLRVWRFRRAKESHGRHTVGLAGSDLSRPWPTGPLFPSSRR